MDGRLDSQPILILGGSTRAAAYSAARAGLRPICGDLFADADLRRIAEVIPLPHYPRGLAAAAQTAPPAPWMYTGAIENHPRQVAEICFTRPLWGNGPDTIAMVRNPRVVAKLLADSRLSCLECRPGGEPPPPDGKWMLKPLRGSAGRGIEVWEPEAARSSTLREAHYFQSRRAGCVPISALYLAAPGKTWMLGAAEQFIGLPELHAAAHQFCGGIVPASLPDGALDFLHRVGAALGAGCGLRGLFGCDFLYDGNIAWLTEVNPRYTATTELYEFVYRTGLLDWHARACVAFETDTTPTGLIAGLDSEIGRAVQLSDGRKIGKAVLYARREFKSRSLARFLLSDAVLAGGADLFGIPTIADVPPEGTPFKPGDPVCSVFARGCTRNECRDGLLAQGRMIEREVLGRL